jgi:hypothetical protein
MAWPHINTEDAIIYPYQYDSKGEPTILRRREGQTLPWVLRLVNYSAKLIYGIDNKSTKYKTQSGQTLAQTLRLVIYSAKLIYSINKTRKLIPSDLYSA